MASSWGDVALAALRSPEPQVFRGHAGQRNAGKVVEAAGAEPAAGDFPLERAVAQLSARLDVQRSVPA